MDACCTKSVPLPFPELCPQNARDKLIYTYLWAGICHIPRLFEFSMVLEPKEPPAYITRRSDMQAKPPPATLEPTLDRLNQGRYACHRTDFPPGSNQLIEALDRSGRSL